MLESLYIFVPDIPCNPGRLTAPGLLSHTTVSKCAETSTITAPPLWCLRPTTPLMLTRLAGENALVPDLPRYARMGGAMP